MTKSRSTWACELKYGKEGKPWKYRYVTLHVSVWVEIIHSANLGKSARSRSTWACELKLFYKALHFGRVGHAPRERVSWNTPFGRVSLRTTASRSTWACELKFNLFKVKSKSSRHAPRERVSWNFGDIHFIVKKFSHAPRERVSWNTLSNDILKTRTMSRSTWACELKYIHGSCGHTSPWSRSTWACELKLVC